MFLINFQLWARNRKIPGGGSFNIRGGFNNRGIGLVGVGVADGKQRREILLETPPHTRVEPSARNTQSRT